MSKKQVARILWKCLVIGWVFLMFWFGMFAFAKEWAFKIHSKWFSMNQTEFNLAHYTGMMWLKILLIVQFLIPWIVLNDAIMHQEDGGIKYRSGSEESVI